ncbi:GNAT family N-acetyltransferase [Caballeronia sp. 15711]|uniref:GNAT family N-acetyltransferase n=1 Tax=Caballeronia sp. 15711 TaxID=3391029 RepID=UPI0039E28F60
MGYRIGQRFGGNGYATKAVELVLARARTELDFWRIEATVRLDNHGSARVLLNNGFVACGTARRSMKLHGVWYDLMHFERHLASCASEVSSCRADRA